MENRTQTKKSERGQKKVLGNNDAAPGSVCWDLKILWKTLCPRPGQGQDQRVSRLRWNPHDVKSVARPRLVLCPTTDAGPWTVTQEPQLEQDGGRFSAPQFQLSCSTTKFVQRHVWLPTVWQNRRKPSLLNFDAAETESKKSWLLYFSTFFWVLECYITGCMSHVGLGIDGEVERAWDTHSQAHIISRWFLQ